MSNEFELDGQRIVLIDTPGFDYNSLLSFYTNCEKVIGDIRNFLAESYVRT